MGHIKRGSRNEDISGDRDSERKIMEPTVCVQWTNIYFRKEFMKIIPKLILTENF